MQLGPFEIVAAIGEGAFGVVYRARRDGREVALKVMHAGDGEISPAEVARFVAEAEKMQRVRHPSLVSLEETGTLPDGRPFLSMPLLGDRSLADQAASTPFAPDHALSLFVGLAGAVAALHDAGLMHRDIKPENVMVLPDRLVLLDLGIARDVTAAPSTTTQAGMSRGTPAYMAPERLLGQPATIASDVYELALVLVVMVLGATPWTEGDATARFRPSLGGTRIPPAWVPILEDALSLDVGKRPASVVALHRALAGVSPHVAASDVAPARADLGLAPTELVPFSSQAAATAEDARLVQSVAPPRGASSSAWYVAIATLVVMGTGGVLVGVWRMRGRSPVPVTTSSVTRTTDSAAIETAEPHAIAPASAPASAPAPRPSSSATASARVMATSTTAPSATTAATAQPASCQQLVALMCSKTSGARPEECTAWKANAAKWSRDLPANVAAETCKAAFDASSAGLAHRRAASAPTSTP